MVVMTAVSVVNLFAVTAANELVNPLVVDMVLEN